MVLTGVFPQTYCTITIIVTFVITVKANQGDSIIWHTFVVFYCIYQYSFHVNFFLQSPLFHFAKRKTLLICFLCIHQHLAFICPQNILSYSIYQYFFPTKFFLYSPFSILQKKSTFSFDTPIYQSFFQHATCVSLFFFWSCDNSDNYFPLGCGKIWWRKKKIHG